MSHLPKNPETARTHTEAPQDGVGDGLGWLRLLVLDFQDACCDFAVADQGKGALYERVVLHRRALLAAVAERLEASDAAKRAA